MGSDRLLFTVRYCITHRYEMQGWFSFIFLTCLLQYLHNFSIREKPESRKFIEILCLLNLHLQGVMKTFLWWSFFVKMVLAVNYIWKKLHHKEVFQTFLKHVKQLEEILSCFFWAVDQGVKWRYKQSYWKVAKMEL